MPQVAFVTNCRSQLRMQMMDTLRKEGIEVRIVLFNHLDLLRKP